MEFLWPVMSSVGAPVGYVCVRNTKCGTTGGLQVLRVGLHPRADGGSKEQGWPRRVIRLSGLLSAG